MKASDQSMLSGPDGTDWSDFSQSYSCHRGPIIFVTFSEYIMY